MGRVIKIQKIYDMYILPRIVILFVMLYLAFASVAFMPLRFFFVFDHQLVNTDLYVKHSTNETNTRNNIVLIIVRSSRQTRVLMGKRRTTETLPNGRSSIYYMSV